MTRRSALVNRTAPLAVLVSLVASVMVWLGAPATAATVPVPEQDPFYIVPPGISGLANGTVLASRQVDASAYSLPLPVHAWQVKYKTLDSEGGATATVTTILVPVSPWLGGGPRPLVSYQTAEDGVAGRCAPSYALRAGLTGGVTNSEAETGLLALALLRGWGVVAPDYEGPESAFLGGPGEAHGVLDGIRAALDFAPAGFGARTAVGMWGYSGGSLATADAAQSQPSYAPELRLTGVALGGLVADVDQTIRAFSGSPVGGAIPMGVNGVLRAYPDRGLQRYLSDFGKQAVAATAHDCISDAVARYPFLTVDQMAAFPGALDRPEVQALLRANGPDGMAGDPTAPVYDYHATIDELAPTPPDRDLMRRYCAAGVPVQHVENPLAEHVIEAVAGAPGAINFLADRFAGHAPVNTCATIPS